MNDNHGLPKRITLVADRKNYTVNFCRNRKVLHIGCADTGRFAWNDETAQDDKFLHAQIAKMAKKLVGIDINLEGIQWLKRHGYEAYKVDLQYDRPQLRAVLQDIDTIVMPEVIEHLDNPGLALDNLYDTGFAGDIFITTPNAFSRAVAITVERAMEPVHRDHNFWFSPTTLKTLLKKHGFKIREMMLYYWPTEDPIGQELKEILPSNPYVAEGIIVIVNRGESIQ